MDSKPDISDIKQEKTQVIVEENNGNYLDFVVRVKVENDIDWDSIQTVLGPNQYPKNSYSHKNYEELIRYGPNEKYQEEINSKKFKEESINYDVISKEFAMQPNEIYDNEISYEELKEESVQTCLLCRKYFSTSYSLLRHNLIHLEVPLIKRKLFMCEHCPQYFKKKKRLKNHILINHYRKFVCSNDEALVTKQKRKCLICNKTYPYKTWFGHMTEVHCARKFKCEKCGLLFKAKRYLKRHKLLHEKVQKDDPKKTNCPKCPAILYSKYALTTHLRNCHSDEKFTCHICKSTLKCRSYLLAHLKRVHHNDGKLHPCEICGKEFKSPRYMQIHLKNSHRNFSSKG